MSKSREQVREYTSQIDVTGKSVLDVGAGEKNNHVRHWVKGKAKCFMTSDIEDKYDPTFVFDLNKLYDMERQFDYVFCIETLEHIWSPLQAVENLVSFTRERLIISVPFINPIHDSWDYFRYTFQWFEKVLPKMGMRNVQITPRRATRGLETMKQFYHEEGLRMSKITKQLGYGDHISDIGYIISCYKG